MFGVEFMKNRIHSASARSLIITSFLWCKLPLELLFRNRGWRFGCPPSDPVSPWLSSGRRASLMRALGSWARSLSPWWTIITPSCTTVVVLWPQSIPYESLGLLGSFTQSLVDHHHTLLHNSGLSSGHTASLMRALGSWARSLSPWWTIITPSCTTVGCPLAAEHPYESLGLLGSFTQSLVDRHHHHTLLHNGGCPLAAEHPL
nr:uncharacterized protein LOC103347245 isoform X9 [Oryctolagus cuniculus]